MPFLAKDGAEKTTTLLIELPGKQEVCLICLKTTQYDWFLYSNARITPTHWTATWRVPNSASSFLPDPFYTAEGLLCNTNNAVQTLFIQPAASCTSEGPRQGKQRNNTDREGLQLKDRLVKQHPDSSSPWRTVPLCRSRSVVRRETVCWEVKGGLVSGASCWKMGGWIE